MNTWSRVCLLAKVTVRVPAVVEEYEHYPHVVGPRQGEHSTHAVLETVRIRLVREIVKKDSGEGEPGLLHQPKFAVDRDRIEGFRLPHLELVDRSARDEIASGRPPLFLCPIVRLVQAPLAGCESHREGGSNHSGTLPGRIGTSRLRLEVSQFASV
jgi:hypothetical protein